MSIDLSKFVETYLDETGERLEFIEAQLLSIDTADALDAETVNAIFRAAHSIKGGAGTFGFTAVSDFTHLVETLLDEIRAGQREFSAEIVDLLLESKDVIAGMIRAARDGGVFDADTVAHVREELERLVGGSHEETAGAQAADGEDAQAAAWRIRFAPYPHLMEFGNDPLRMFEVLSEMGDLEVEADVSGLPSLDELNAREMHTRWTLTLRADVEHNEIAELFEWVEDDCDLSIERAEEVEDESRHIEEVEDEPTKASAPAETPTAAGRSTGGRSAASSGSIRVSIDKIDSLINIAGELVITQSMLDQTSTDMEEHGVDLLEKLRDGLAQLERNTRELQEGVMRIRMVPISFAFNRVPRLVHDLSAKFGKQIDLGINGEQTELDKTVMEKLGDPLVHLVRNAIDHGIETPEERLAAGKPAVGTIELSAFHEGGKIVVEIKDDGAGLNTEAIVAKARAAGVLTDSDSVTDAQAGELIFHPGLSTASEVSDVSGRGVGMDVVRRNINSLGGSVTVDSKRGQGTTFTIRLPLTLAILDGQLVQVGEQVYVVPLLSIVESLQPRDEFIKSLSGSRGIYKLRDEYIPVIRVHEVFDVDHECEELTEGLLVVVENGKQRAGLFVDDLLGQQQVVIKSLEENFKRVEGVSGATILGDGTVALILDIGGLMRLGRNQARANIATANTAATA
ncbi:chemotaxis protein CheA [Persicimonas caeni]|uniref:Chemotaxis protein CheA n=1 Tax=Persicimonas caeni TaxID=2292766 RepID=A0A4Y6PZ43_PERCE|nr:chemotaxis protein CheA [Persicimonas caeni]QDG53582.1 chemotaxis protein CheA [Persicimonas caeni]QED34803.1 chemotaxis protein CheA [Persicimonas caeni]